MPPGPSLCERLTETAASDALGFAVRPADGGTSISCVYTGSGERTGTVLSLTASDAGDDVGQILVAAESASTSFARLPGVGDGAYVAVVDGRPQGAVIAEGRQYSVTLSATPPLEADDAEAAITEALRALDARLDR